MLTAGPTLAGFVKNATRNFTLDLQCINIDNGEIARSPLTFLRCSSQTVNALFQHETIKNKTQYFADLSMLQLQTQHNGAFAW